MLISNVNGELVGASMVKDSSFYIEIAKFVQAYTTIIKNPNEFLREIGEKEIDEKQERLDWDKFVLIMQKCDLGFENKPTNTDLIVYYNYALEIGSLDSAEKKLASVGQVADAQKHYYNFIDEATDKAKTEYLKQHRIAESRAREMSAIDNKLSGLMTVKCIAFFMQIVGVLLMTFGTVSFFAENSLAMAIGGVFKVWKAQYIGAIVMLVFGLIIFVVFDKIFLSYKLKHKKLKDATVTIFKRSDESIADEKFLKSKLDELQQKLSIVQTEINDKKHRFDVKYNIDKLKSTNKFYQKLCENEEEFVGTEKSIVSDTSALENEDFAPIKLTKEQSENLLTVGKEAISLEGQLDEEAFNEKFEKGRETQKTEADNSDEKEAEEESIEKLENQEQELLDSIDYIKEILGFAESDLVFKEEEKKKEQKEIEEAEKEK